MDVERLFHPLVAEWFRARFGEPTPPQAEGWPAIARGCDTLIAAPTGSGKTLAAFLWSINGLVDRAVRGELADRTYVVYVSPLKALSNDVEKNLQRPLQEIRECATRAGVTLPEIRVAVRTGDTPSADRARMLRKPPHVLITTPESLYIALTAEGSRNFLAGAETVIVDEIHAIAGDKRGLHQALTLERLDHLIGHPVQRIGLSATQKPIERIAQLLVGARGLEQVAIVDTGHQREMELSIEIPDQELGPIATHELWAETYDRIVQQVHAHRTTLVFVNTRRQVERVSFALGERLGDERVAAHHGSLSRETRLKAEQRLKNGEIPVMVATASLELGIDIGHVDLVCHIGAPRLISTLLQRVGRSGHWLGAIPKGVIYPMTRDDLLQAAAAIRAVRQGELDRIVIPENARDILAQQIVATVATGDIGVEELFHLVRRAFPYRNLARAEFDAVVEMLSEGIATSRGRQSAHLHFDRVHGILRARRGARLAAITSGGAIPDLANYDVVEEPSGTFVGQLHEDFAVESLAGDVFLLGNHSWRIKRVELGRVRVEDAHGAAPTMPFWLGEAPARSPELSEAVACLREEVATRLGNEPLLPAPSPARGAGAVRWLQEEIGLPRAGAEQIVEYVAETVRALGAVPTRQTVVAERFFDESGGMQLVLHTPFGGRINRAWGLALRKRFCVTFDFELQAAATDDGVLISLGAQHSFPMDAVWSMVRLSTLRADLLQAALQSPVFGTRWRWNITRALALLRSNGGKRVPIHLQRMRAEDLLAAVFPGSLACQDNHPGGPIDPPDHPLVNETIDNCLTEWMDLEGLREVVEAIERGEIRTVAVETAAPSLMSHEILAANPYAYLDDAPLEERRARAVSLRRADPELASGIGALDPEAIAQVRAQAWPDVRNAEELHDLLLNLGWMPVDQPARRSLLGAEPLRPVANPTVDPPAARPGVFPFEWMPHARELLGERRVAIAMLPTDSPGPVASALVAAERLPWLTALFGSTTLEPTISAPPGVDLIEEDEAAKRVVQGWLELLGPASLADLVAWSGLLTSAVEMALPVLEGHGVAMQGRYLAGEPGLQWCDRRLLARIHHLTLGRLRQEIQPVTTADLMRFLLRWQHLAPGTQRHGPDGLLMVIEQLQGMELPAPAWEAWVLKSRISGSDPVDLEQLCLAGLVSWGRLSPVEVNGEEAQPSPRPPRPGGRNSFDRPVSPARRQSPGRQAPLAFVLREDLEQFLPPRVPIDQVPGLSHAARDVAEYLERRGASFLAEISRGTGRLPAEVEDALWELVARGLATGDGIAGLRVLLQPEARRRSPGPSLARSARGAPIQHHPPLTPAPSTSSGQAVFRAGRGGSAAALNVATGPRRQLPVGRWSLWGSDAPAPEVTDEAEAAEPFARQLLRRYGVVFRDLLARERLAPPWRVLLRVYRRLEARGEIRGGRFVAGFAGEQFALPEAVEALRAVRRQPATGETILVGAGDPLNLVGILTPGARISPYTGQVIAYRDGVPIEIGPLGLVESHLQFQARQELGDLRVPALA